MRRVAAEADRCRHEKFKRALIARKSLPKQTLTSDRRGRQFFRRMQECFFRRRFTNVVPPPASLFSDLLRRPSKRTSIPVDVMAKLRRRVMGSRACLRRTICFRTALRSWNGYVSKRVWGPETETWFDQFGSMTGWRCFDLGCEKTCFLFWAAV